MVTPRQNKQASYQHPKSVYYQNLWKANMREVRHARGMTIKQVSEISGIHHISYQHLETEDSSPQIEMMLKVSCALGLTIDEMLLQDAKSIPKRGGRYSEALLNRIKTRISSNVRAARILKGWTQSVVAEMSGLNRVRWAEIEAGYSSPKLSTIVVVADTLLMTPGELISRDLEKEHPEVLKVMRIGVNKE